MCVAVKNILELEEAMQMIKRMDYTQMGVSAAEFAASHFDCRELNKRIVERKNKLLNYRDWIEC